MSFPKCSVETNNVQKLADSPTQSAQDLKKVFDKAGEDIKEYINDKLLPAITKDIGDSKTDTQKLILKTYKYNATTLAEITETEDYTIPATYKVNTYGLDVYFEGTLLALNEHYQERGTGTSDKIRFNFTVPKDSVLTFVIRK